MNDLFPGLSVAPNVHPMLVHFPLAIWMLALLFFGLGALRRKDREVTFGRWLVYLGALSAGLALATGYIAADQMGHDSAGHDLVHVHRDFMVAASVLGGVVALAAFVTRKRTDSMTRWLLVGGLVVTNGVSALGADRGAAMVYGYGVGTAGLEAPATDGHDHDHGDGAEGHDDSAEGHGDEAEGHGHEVEGHGDEAEGHGHEVEGHGDEAEGHGHGDEGGAPTSMAAPPEETSEPAVDEAQGGEPPPTDSHDRDAHAH